MNQPIWFCIVFGEPQLLYRSEPKGEDLSAQCIVLNHMSQPIWFCIWFNEPKLLYRS